MMTCKILRMGTTNCVSQPPTSDPFGSSFTVSSARLRACMATRSPIGQWLKHFRLFGSSGTAEFFLQQKLGDFLRESPMDRGMKRPVTECRRLGKCHSADTWAGFLPLEYSLNSSIFMYFMGFHGIVPLADSGPTNAFTSSEGGAMATANKILSASTAYDLRMNSTQMPPSPAKPTGLPLPKFFYPQGPTRGND